jgi:hypothetical protein
MRFFFPQSRGGIAGARLEICSICSVMHNRYIENGAALIHAEELPRLHPVREYSGDPFYGRENNASIRRIAC